jgi:predicted enzyme related to lactoylglutathione lyase
MANPFVHLELTTRDLPKAKQFYSALVSWQLRDMPMADGKSYTMINVGDGTDAHSSRVSAAPRTYLKTVLGAS